MEKMSCWSLKKDVIEDESFWRSVHRKHVMEDLKDLKVTTLFL